MKGLPSHCCAHSPKKHTGTWDSAWRHDLSAWPPKIIYISYQLSSLWIFAESKIHTEIDLVVVLCWPPLRRHYHPLTRLLLFFMRYLISSISDIRTRDDDWKWIRITTIKTMPDMTMLINGGSAWSSDFVHYRGTVHRLCCGCHRTFESSSGRYQTTLRSPDAEC